ncbi:hypothetical protein RJ55_02975 [Drechmeria coniospora]|nr:hypothetical protein RJ55_02975 [Drechmeria coniospora]
MYTPPTVELSSPATRLLRRQEPLILYPQSLVPVPVTTPALTANLVMRVLLALVGNIVCIIPLGLLYRNGEFAAVVFIVLVMLLNLDTVVNSLLWHNNDTADWWHGVGYCDLDNFFRNASKGLYLTCLLAIMRNLAQQVGMMRAGALTAAEKRRRNLTQALIMFPLPIVMLAWTFPLTAQRYVIGTLVGCDWVPHSSWPYLVFFILPPVVVGFATVVYAVLTYYRYRQVSKTTVSALASNRAANRRSQRTRRRLYMMVISILIPFFPIVVTLAVLNILAMGSIKPFSYDTIHNHATPLPWNTVVLVTSNDVPWAYMNSAYIPILTTVPIFAFFGTTIDALNQYRVVLVFVGLAKFFPSLRREYDPDRVPTAANSLDSNQTAAMTGTSSNASRKVAPTTDSSRQQPGTPFTSADCAELQIPEMQTIDFATTVQLENGLGGEEIEHQETSTSPPRRGPFSFGTPFHLPNPFRFSVFRSTKEKSGAAPAACPPAVPLENAQQAVSASPWEAQAGTPRPHPCVRPEDEDETALFNTSTRDHHTDCTTPEEVMADAEKDLEGQIPHSCRKR